MRLDSEEQKAGAIRSHQARQMAREYKRQLLTGEEDAALELLAALRAITQRLRPQWERTLASLVALANDGDLEPPLAGRNADLRDMLNDTELELSRFNQLVGMTVDQRREALIDIAESNIYDLARAVAGEVDWSWSRLSRGFVETLVGTMKPGNPAYDMLMSFAPNATERMREAVVTGLSIGQTPEKILKEFDDALGVNKHRALTILRTEDMRAYRLTTDEAMQANEDVVIGWRWHASLSYGTCVACLSLHGEVFPLGTEMHSHPNCRCVQIPVLKDVPLEKWQTGEEWLRDQPEDIQKRVLGPGKLDAWLKGEFTLADFRGHKVDKTFGPMYVEIGLENARQLRQSRTSRPYVPARFSSDPEQLIEVIRKTGALDNTTSEPTVWMRRTQVNSVTGADAILEQIAIRQGFTGLPLVVSPEEMQQLLRANAAKLPFKETETLEQFIESGIRGAVPLNRNLFHSDEKPDIPVTEYARQFKDGDYFAGKWNRFGSGIYFWPHEDDLPGALKVKAAFREGARVVHMDKLQEEMKAAGYDDRIPVGYNHGHYAAAKGYDGIMVTEDTGNVIFVVLNRTALAVER